LSGRGLCDGLITRPEVSYRLWRVVVCDQETSKSRRLKPATGLWIIQPQWVVTPGKQTANKLDLYGCVWSTNLHLMKKNTTEQYHPRLHILSVCVCVCLCVCSLRYPACIAHVPYCHP
jgi:hypothetical protein